MKFTVITTEVHEGKVLEMNTDREVVTLHSATGELLGALPWGTVIEQLLAGDEEVRFAHARSHPRAPLALKVRYTTPEGKQFDSLTGGIGAGGLFIESSAPLAPGTELSVEFALPDRPWENTRPKRRSPGSARSLNGICSSPEWVSNLPTSMTRLAKSLSNSSMH